MNRNVSRRSLKGQNEDVMPAHFTGPPDFGVRAGGGAGKMATKREPRTNGQKKKKKDGVSVRSMGVPDSFKGFFTIRGSSSWRRTSPRPDCRRDPPCSRSSSPAESTSLSRLRSLRPRESPSW
eukprot:g45757.t1